MIFRVKLDSTGLSVILWEVGLLGCFLLFSIILYVFFLTKPQPILGREGLTEDDIRLVSFQPALRAFTLGCLLSFPYS